jgi:hypothetical protein
LPDDGMLLPNAVFKASVTSCGVKRQGTATEGADLFIRTF